MAWRTINGNSYYVHNERVGGRVVQKHFGSGYLGLIAERVHAEARHNREQRRAELREENERYDEAEKGFASILTDVRVLAKAALVAVGYHQHKGVWRRRRGFAMNEIVPAPKAGPQATVTRDEIKALIDRADGGDEAALQRLREVVRSPGCPALAGMSAGFVDPSHGLKIVLLHYWCGKDRRGSWLAARKLIDQVRDDLAGPNPTPIEALLAARAALLWYGSYMAEIGAAGEGASDRQRRRAESAGRRFEAALLALARVRKLAVPTLTLNVAQNQVNLTGG
jgi:hypothetical protein